jgi:hypothetical protein
MRYDIKKNHNWWLKWNTQAILLVRMINLNKTWLFSSYQYQELTK